MMKRNHFIIAITITADITTMTILEMIGFTRKIRTNAMLALLVSLQIAFPTVLPNLIQAATSNVLQIAIRDVLS